MHLLRSLLDPVVCSFLLLILSGGYVLYQLFICPLAKVPGPFLAKLTSWYLVYITVQPNHHHIMLDLHKRHGNIVRIGPNKLSVADPGAFREIYKAGGKYRKDATYNVLKGTRPFDLTGQRDEKIHGEQRRLVARAYSMDSMVHLEPKVDSVIIQTMDKLAEQRGFFDLGTWIQLFAFDVIGAVSFSVPFGYVRAGDDKGVFRRIQNSLASLAWLRYSLWFYNLHQTLLPIIGNWLAANDRNGYFFQFAKERVEAHHGDNIDSKDILSQLFARQKDKPELNDTNITFMLTSNVFAGSDTTSTAMQGILYLLLKHPEYYNQMIKEMQERVANGKLSYPVTFQQAESWSFLQAVMHEGMRLLPSVGSVLPREVPAGGMQCGDYWVPEGTGVGTNAWVLHRVPEIWGEDAEAYRPERWLAPGANELKRYFFAFGGGSRTCIGRNISWLEMSKFIPTLLMGFHVELATDARLRERFAALVIFEGLEVKLSPRGDKITENPMAHTLSV